MATVQSETVKKSGMGGCLRAFLIVTGIVVALLIIAAVAGGGRSIGSSSSGTANQAAVSYFQLMGSSLGSLSPSLTRYADLFDRPNMSDPVWRAGVRAEVAIWHRTYLQLQAITPPSHFATSHAAIVAGVSNLDLAGQAMDSAVSTGDLSKALGVRSLVDAASSQIVHANDLLRQEFASCC